MSILAWIVLGLLAGSIGSTLVFDIVLRIVGALVGSFFFNLFGASTVTGLNLYSLLVAVVGAVLLLVAFHVIRRRNLAWYRR